MQRDARSRCPGTRPAALLIAAAGAAAPLSAHQGPETVRVGRVEAVYWSGDATLATALAEFADQAGPFPGLTQGDERPIRLLVTRSGARYDSLTAGRLPGWSTGAAIPQIGTIILKVSGDPWPTLRHELAHLALHRATRARIPLWFDEGYAARAAGEWSRLDALEVNWALVRGDVPSFTRLSRELRAGPAHARAAYGLATTAVLYLERLGGGRGLVPLLTNLRDAPTFDAAVRRTNYLSVEQLEALWQRDLRTRYGWLRIFTSFGVFWSATAAIVGVLWWRRRRFDRVRKAHLDEGWIIPSDAPSPDA